MTELFLRLPPRYLSGRTGGQSQEMGVDLRQPLHLYRGFFQSALLSKSFLSLGGRKQGAPLRAA